MGAEMGRNRVVEGSLREQQIRNLLTRMRAHELGRLKVSRRAAEEDLVTEPGDDLDDARADEDRELHESLVSRSEDRLNAIEAALVRLDDGSYGICAACGGEVAIKRLQALPFTPYCAGCAESRAESHAAGILDRHVLRHWNAPGEMAEPIDRDETLELAAAAIGSGERFAPSGKPAPAKPARAAAKAKKRKAPRKR
ncbi:MAG: TraR/DksA family transcriptional regulator [Candidatus Binataceae bacterium]